MVGSAPPELTVVPMMMWERVLGGCDLTETEVNEPRHIFLLPQLSVGCDVKVQLVSGCAVTPGL